MKTFDTFLKEWDRGQIVFKSVKPAYLFVRKNEIWKGLMNYGWVSKLFLLILVCFGLGLINLMFNWPNSQNQNASMDSSGIMSSFSFLKVFSDEMFLSGSGKYLLLLILEVVIFHCSVKTLNIISGKSHTPVFQDFVNAEIRMVKIIIRSIIMEALATILVVITIGIFFPEMVKNFCIFLVQAFYFGYAFMDNYNEQYGLNIKESSMVIKQHTGAAIAIGLVVYFLMIIPLIGFIIAPIFGSVLATFYMYYEGVNKTKIRHLEGSGSAIF